MFERGSSALSQRVGGVGRGKILAVITCATIVGVASVFSEELAAVLAVAPALWLFLRKQPDLKLFLVLALLGPFDAALNRFVPAFPYYWKEVLTSLIWLIGFAEALRRRSFRMTAAGWWLVGLWGVYVLSLLYTDTLYRWAWGMKVALFYTPLYFWAANRRWDFRDIARVLHLMFAIGIVNALYSLVQFFYLGVQGLLRIGYVWMDEVRTAYGMVRVFGTFAHNKPLAGYLVIVLLINIAVYEPLWRSTRLKRAVFAAGTSLMMTALVLTWARDAWFGFIGGLLLAMGLRRRRAAHPLIVPAIILITLVTLRFAEPGFVSSLRPFSATDESGVERVMLWKTYFSSWLSQPYGMGAGTTGAAAERVAEQTLGVRDYITIDGYYLKVAFETGVQGIALFLALYLSLLVGTLRKLRRGAGRHLELGVAAVLLYLGIASISTNVWEEFPNVIFVWVFVGIINNGLRVGNAYETEVRRKSEEEASPTLLRPAISR